MLTSYLKGLLVGRLNQKQKCLHVQSVVSRDIHRDVDTGDINDMINTLMQWKQNCDTLIEKFHESNRYKLPARVYTNMHVFVYVYMHVYIMYVYIIVSSY